MHKLLAQIVQYFNRPFEILNSLQKRLLFASGMFVFSLMFLIVFIPFNITEWIVYTSPFKALQIQGLGLIVGIIIVVSQMLQYLLFRNYALKLYHLIIGLFLDVFIISIPLSLLYAIPANSLWIEFRETIAIVAPLTVLCYLLVIGFMVFRNDQKLKKQHQVDILSRKLAAPVDRINIKDSNGQIRLSLRPDDLLYFESADNYVIVHFRKKQQSKREMIRNSLKNIEIEHYEHNCIRCHRSYIINLSNVATIVKQGRTYEIAFDGLETKIPISRGHVKTVKDMLEG